LALSPCSMGNHNSIHNSRHSGTAARFVQGDTFSEWKGSSSLLWTHGKRQFLVRYPFNISALSTYSVGQFHNHPGHRRLAEMWARIARIFYCDLRRHQKDMHGLLSSALSARPTRTVISFLFSIRHNYCLQNPSDGAPFRAYRIS
jgi:hypothetical protein